MLRKKEDMKEWQVEALKEEDVIPATKAPEGFPTDDLIDVPQEAIEAPKPKKATAKKKAVKKIPVEE